MNKNGLVGVVKSGESGGGILVEIGNFRFGVEK